MKPLERPVIIVDEEPEEDKLFVILSHRNSAYLKVSPAKAAATPNSPSLTHGAHRFKQVQPFSVACDILFCVLLTV